MITLLKYFLPCLLIIFLLQGCAAAVVTGGVAGAAVAHDTRTAGTVIEDEAIELKASKAFFSDKEINDNAHLNVISYNMVVLVTGEAPNEALRDRIITIVREIPKVKQVYNEVTIAAPSSLVSRSSDSLITSKVKTKLIAMKDVAGTNIKVVTEKGIVYLMGLISREASDRATEATRQVGGVQKVVKLFQYID